MKNINDMRNTKENEYIEFLYCFAHVLYKRKHIENTLKNNSLSDLLTPSDEAFLLLCAKVYYENDCDIQYNGNENNNKYIIRSGWQDEGISLYNYLYKRVTDDREQNNVTFDACADSYIQFITDQNGGSQMLLPSKKRFSSHACNDL